MQEQANIIQKEVLMDLRLEILTVVSMEITVF
jgi:hypothetical protein